MPADQGLHSLCVLCPHHNNVPGLVHSVREDIIRLHTLCQPSLGTEVSRHPEPVFRFFCPSCRTQPQLTKQRSAGLIVILKKSELWQSRELIFRNSRLSKHLVVQSHPEQIVQS